MKFIFVDTLYLVALSNPQDQWRDRAREIRSTIESCKLITTEAVLIEFLNYFSAFKPVTRQTVAGIVYDILDDPNIEVVPVNRDLFFSRFGTLRTTPRQRL